ncbi:KS-MAT linker domain-containing protein [Lentzea chajnantorensis]
MSARTERSLHRLLTELADLLPHGRQDPSGGPGLAPPDFTAAVWTLQTGRAQLAQRVVILAEDAGEFAVAAHAFLRGEPHPLVLHDTVDPAELAAADHDVPEPELRVAARWLTGERVEWAVLWPEEQRPRRVPLSAYPFDRISCWHESFGSLGS